MSPTAIERPATDEYADYYHRYVRLVPAGDVLATLETQLAGTLALLDEIGEDGASFRYAPGKWSVKQVVGHVLDIEWVFTQRALRFARGDETPLPGIDQDKTMEGAGFDRLPLADLANQLRLVRAASVALFRGFPPEAWQRAGTASGYHFTTRAIPHIIAGHELHHRRILHDRYQQGGG